MVDKKEKTELAPTFQPPSLVPTQKEQAAAFRDQSFIPPMKLLQGLSKEIEDKKNNAGDFFITSQGTNLTAKVNIVPIHRRNHALLIVNNKKSIETFNDQSPLWNEIKFTPEDRQSQTVVLCGSEWLFFIPSHGICVTYFCGRSSNKPLTGDLSDYLLAPKERATEIQKEKPYTNYFELYSHFETKKWGDKYKAWVPMITPLDPFNPKDLPKDSINQAIQTFFSPVANEPVLEDITSSEGASEDR